MVVAAPHPMRARLDGEDVDVRLVLSANRDHPGLA